jgi:type IV pilus assembly protein PilA
MNWPTAAPGLALRARVIEAVIAADGLKPAVAEFREREERCPRNGEGGIGSADAHAGPTIAAVEVEPGEGACTIMIRLAGPANIAGKYLAWSLDAAGAWHFSSDLPPRYLPASLRASAGG